MAMKIDASIEEIKSWVSDEDIFNMLSAFDIIKVDEFCSVEEDFKISLNQVKDRQESKLLKETKINMVFDNVNNQSMKFNNYIVKAAA